MSSRMRSRLSVVSALLALALAILGCSISSGSSTAGGGGTTGGGGGGGGGGSTPTPSPPPAPPPHALAWYQYDSANIAQIWASINGAAPVQITHAGPDHADCVDQLAWSPPVFSPDLTHIVAALGSFQCSDGPMYGRVSIITVSSGAIAPVPALLESNANDVRLTERVAGWIDNSTVWYINYGGLYTYTIGAGGTTLIDPLHSPEDAVLRGSTLFWSNFISGGPGGGSSASTGIHRYNISTHAALPGTISQGTMPECGCSPGDYRLLGWDASPDGAHVAYQVGSLSGGGMVSQFFYANADGSGASQIASYATAHSVTRMQISPNGALVAISGALPSPTVVTASVTSPGHSGDPNLNFYAPDASSYPVWKWDTTTIWVANEDYFFGGAGGTPGTLYHYDLGVSPGTVGIAGGYNPWYTIG